MDKRSEFEITNEQRSLLNAGHGPPVQLPDTVHFFQGPRPTTLDQHYCSGSSLDQFGNPEYMTGPGAACSRLMKTGFCDNKYKHPVSSWLVPSLLNEEKKLMLAIKERDKLIRKLTHELEETRTDNGQQHYESLLKQNEDLQRQLAWKLTECEELRTRVSRSTAKYQHLTSMLSSLPDLPTGTPTNNNDSFIHLVATEELAQIGNTEEKEMTNNDDDVALVKSVQCSEPSVEEPTCENGNMKETKVETTVKKEGALFSPSSSSGTSFEVIGHDSFAHSPTLRHLCNRQSVSYGDKCLSEVFKTATVNFKDELEFLRWEIKRLEGKLEEEKEERIKGDEMLSKKLSEVAEKEHNDEVHKERTTEVSSHGVNSPDSVLEVESLRKNVAELEAANWKLTEQKVELTKQNEDLKKMEQEQRSHSVSLNVKKLQEELMEKVQQGIEMEEQLRIKHLCIIEMEARIKNLEQTNAPQSAYQDTTFNETTMELATENALLKHQIEAYKEDFEVERKDREKLVSQRDTLQHCYDTLRSDLDVARQQLKKYEKDITLLRLDNNALKSKLWQVTEELTTLKDQQQFKAGLPVAAQNHPLAAETKTAVQNSFAPKPGPPFVGQSSDWECRVCTFKNAAPRRFCEMCGTQKLPKSSQDAEGVFMPNILTRELQALPSTPASPLLSNLRNYGDIETD